jgi:hypothetical protein
VLGSFREGGQLADYVEVRDLIGISPDPRWLEEFDVPPDDLIAEHVRAWTVWRNLALRPCKIASRLVTT